MPDKEVSNEALQHDIHNLCDKFDRFVASSQMWRDGIDKRLRSVEVDLAKHQSAHNGNPKKLNGWRSLVEKFYAPVTVAVLVWLLIEIVPNILSHLAAAP